MLITATILLVTSVAYAIITPVRGLVPPDPGDVQTVIFDYPVTTQGGTLLSYADSPAIVVMVANTSNSTRPVAELELLDGANAISFTKLTEQRGTSNPAYAHSGIWIIYRDQLVYKADTKIRVRFTGGTGGHMHILARTFTGVDPGGTTANNGYKIDSGTGQLFGEIAMASGLNGSLMLDCLAIRNGTNALTAVGVEEVLVAERRNTHQSAMGETENIANGVTRTHRWQWSSNPRYMAHTAIMLKTAIHTITLASNPPGIGNLTGGGVYEHGTTVNVNAVAPAGWAFQNWTLGGVVVSGSPNYSFPAAAIGTLTANFVDVAAPYITDVTVQDEDNVIVVFSEPVQIMDAIEQSNYSVSGSGKGSLTLHPQDVASITPSTYRLRWGFPNEMFNGGDIIITAVNIRDLDSNPILTSSSGTDVGGGIGVSPTALCKDITVSLGFSGTVTVQAADIDNGSTDNRALGYLLIDGGSNRVFSCQDVGVNMVTLTAVDAAGHVSTCQATVTVNDGIVPEVFCKTAFVQLNALGEGTLDPEDVLSLLDDNCGITFAHLSVAPDTFTCADLGFQTVTLTVTDPGGNTAFCNATVGVSYGHNPTVLCRDITVALGADGTASIIPSDVDNGSLDGCGIVSMQVQPNIFTCANLGPNVVTLSATNTIGFSRSCTAVVTVVDDFPPTLAFPDAIVMLECGAEAEFPEPVVDDNCSNVTVTLTDAGGLDLEQASVGDYVVEFTADDGSGNTDTASLAVEVRDTVPPVVTIPGSNPQYVLFNDNTYVPPTASALDICDGPRAAQLMDDGGLDTTLLNTYYLTYEAEDSAGNTGTAILEVIISGDLPPVITLQGTPMATLNCGDVYADAGATASDDVDGDLTTEIIVTGLPPVDTPLVPGVWTIEYNVTDSGGKPADPVTRTVTVLNNCPLQLTALEPTTVVQQPGKSASFAVEATGAVGPVTYQWYRQNENKARTPVGANSEVLTIHAVIEEDSGEYLCEATDAVTSVESELFTLIVFAAIPATSFLGLLIAAVFAAVSGGAFMRKSRR